MNEVYWATMNEQSRNPQGSAWSLVQALREYSEVSERVVERSGSQRGLHRTDMRTLSLLMNRQAEGLVTTPSDLSRILGISSASTTALIDRMVGHGHAERSPSERDRRSVSVTHTDSAAREGRSVFMPIAQHTMRHLAEFSDEEIATAVRVLQAATEAMREAEEELRE